MSAWVCSASTEGVTPATGAGKPCGPRGQHQLRGCQRERRAVGGDVQVHHQIQRAQREPGDRCVAGDGWAGCDTGCGFHQSQQLCVSLHGVTNRLQVCSAFRFGEHDAAGRQGAQKGQVVSKEVAASVVDAHHQPLRWQSGGGGVHPGVDRLPRCSFVHRRNCILQIQDDALGLACCRFGKAFRAIARNEEVGVRGPACSCGAHTAASVRKASIWAVL